MNIDTEEISWAKSTESKSIITPHLELLRLADHNIKKRMKMSIGEGTRAEKR
jgi:hypothetical protein